MSLYEVRCYVSTSFLLLSPQSTDSIQRPCFIRSLSTPLMGVGCSGLHSHYTSKWDEIKGSLSSSFSFLEPTDLILITMPQCCIISCILLMFSLFCSSEYANWIALLLLHVSHDELYNTVFLFISIFRFFYIQSDWARVINTE